MTSCFPPFHTPFARRQALRHAMWASGSLTLAFAGWPTQASGQTASAPGLLSIDEMISPLAGKQRPRSDGIALTLPGLADNGHLVPARIVVDSPMTEADHVSRIWLLSQRNPVTRMATFYLGPWSGRAEISTRVRLAGTQVVAALAQCSNGEFRLATAEVVVTESACLDMT